MAKPRLGLMRLLQLSSSNLPVGGYTFSQGLEYAIDAGWVPSEREIAEWIEHSARCNLAFTDLPLMLRQFTCCRDGNECQSSHWNDVALALRETREILAADQAMGAALVRLASSLDFHLPDYCHRPGAEVSYVSVYSVLACNFSLPFEEAASGYCWTVIESQVMAATKLLPMGQTSAQRMLFDLSEIVDDCIEVAVEVKDDEIGLSLPGLAMASALHETQYSRLYRS